jgi:uncharacterized protein YndB with AHSA1/START domain
MEKIEFVYETFIRTTPQRLWDAITKPEFTRQYWGGGENRSDWNKGSKWQHVHPEEKDPVCAAGDVLESMPPKRLVLTWADPDDPEDASRVVFEIEPLEDMVRLKIVHGGFKPGSASAPKVSWGWPRVLSSLKSFIETGKGLNVWAGH